MEFLVWIKILLPPEMAAEERAALAAAERDSGRRLRANGSIVRIWRIPGQAANVGIWSADDADELHDRLSSLPMFNWMQIDCVPLATHPLERDGEAVRGRGGRDSRSGETAHEG